MPSLWKYVYSPVSSTQQLEDFSQSFVFINSCWKEDLVWAQPIRDLFLSSVEWDQHFLLYPVWDLWYPDIAWVWLLSRQKMPLKFSLHTWKEIISLWNRCTELNRFAGAGFLLKCDEGNTLPQPSCCFAVRRLWFCSFTSWFEHWLQKYGNSSGPWSRTSCVHVSQHSWAMSSWVIWCSLLGGPCRRILGTCEVQDFWISCTVTPDQENNKRHSWELVLLRWIVSEQSRKQENVWRNH